MADAIAYSPKSAAKAFEPPLSEKTIRKLIRAGAFRTVKISNRTYLLRSEIEAVLRELSA